MFTGCWTKREEKYGLSMRRLPSLRPCGANTWKRLCEEKEIESRSAWQRTDILVFSKPQPTERLVLSRFASAYGQVVAAVAAMFLGAIVGRLVAYGGLSGFPAYGIQFGRAVGVLFFASALSFMLALLGN